MGMVKNCTLMLLCDHQNCKDRYATRQTFAGPTLKDCSRQARSAGWRVLKRFSGEADGYMARGASEEGIVWCPRHRAEKAPSKGKRPVDLSGIEHSF